MKTQRGFVSAAVLIAIVLGLIVIGGGAYFVKHQNPTSETSQNYPDISTTQHTQAQITNAPAVQQATNATQSAAQSQLARELALAAPQFIDPANPPSNLKKIAAAIATIVKSDAQSVTVSAVGKRYILVSVNRPTDKSVTPEIFDLVAQKIVGFIPGLYQFTVGKSQVYVSATDVCTYTLDQAACVPLQGAKLSGGEVYGDDNTMGAYFVPQDLSHTETSMTLTVLAWVNPYTNQAKLQKVRDVTLSLTGGSSNNGYHAINKVFAVDANHAYFIDAGDTQKTIMIEGVDVETFVSTGDYTAKDATHRYSITGKGFVWVTSLVTFSDTTAVSGRASLNVLFSTPFSQDRDAPTVSFGDGSPQAVMQCTRDGCSISHTYIDPGVYTASLSFPSSTIKVTVTQ